MQAHGTLMMVSKKEKMKGRKDRAMNFPFALSLLWEVHWTEIIINN